VSLGRTRSRNLLRSLSNGSTPNASLYVDPSTPNADWPSSQPSEVFKSPENVSGSLSRNPADYAGVALSGVWAPLPESERVSTKTGLDAKGFDPRLLPPETNPRSRFSRFRDFGNCAVARESVRFCALTRLVIPPEVVELAWAALEDRGATEREVKLARWVLLSTLRGSHKG